MLMHMLRSIRSVRWLLLSTLFLFLPNMSFGQVVGVSITVAPPALPVYVQPICPADNYIWTPGYWAYSDDDYYFVPGTWVEAPTPGFLWTPGYWGFNNGVYAWNDGYWGPHVGFYGGVNYGFGYGGVGFEGGYWQGGNFFYNRSVSNINVTVIHNVYSKTVINNYNSTTRASFNGPGGVTRKPTAQEETFSHEQHTPAVASQTQHREAASKDRSQFASVNHGKPAVAATAKPGEFRGAGVVAAKAAAPYRGATGKEVAKKEGAATEHKGTTPAATEPKAASNAHAEHEVPPKTKAEPKPKPEAKPKTEPKTENTPKAEPKREAAPKAQPKHESEPKAQPEHEAAPKAAPQAKPEHESAPKAEPKHEAAPKAASKPASKPAPKETSKPEEKPPKR